MYSAKENEAGLWIIAVLMVILGVGIGFLIMTGLYWVICWAFGMVFSWKIAVGVWVIYLLILNIFNRRRRI